MWQQTLDIFLEGYSPAQSLTESTHQFSTQEILCMLSNHTGDDIKTNDLVKALSEKGFIYKKTGILEMEWLFKTM